MQHFHQFASSGDPEEACQGMPRHHETNRAGYRGTHIIEKHLWDGQLATSMTSPPTFSHFWVTNTQFPAWSSLVTLCLFFSNSEKCNVHTMSLLGFRALPYYKEGRIFKRLRVFVHPWNWKFKRPVTEGGGGLIVSRYSVKERKCCLVGKFWP